MLKQETIELFKEKVKRESGYTKYLKEETLSELLKCFNTPVETKLYLSLKENPLELVLDFFKHYNVYYYDMILLGIREHKIIIGEDVEQSVSDHYFTLIELLGNTSDFFRLAHELAHYVDRNPKPEFTRGRYVYMCEVFSYFIEKQLEMFLLEKGMSKTVYNRRYNRIAMVTYLSKIIRDMLDYEETYRKTGTIDVSDKEKISDIMQYNKREVVNSLLRYPLGEVCSEYLIRNNIEYNQNTTEFLRNQNFEDFLSLARKRKH